MAELATQRAQNDSLTKQQEVNQGYVNNLLELRKQYSDLAQTYTRYKRRVE